MLSILIPNFNHAHYLPNCLAAVLKEAPQDTEILVIDDASTDASVAVVEAIMKMDRRVKLYRNETNKGVNATVNYGLTLMGGEFFFGLAADDRILPQFFQKTLSILKRYPEVQLCSSDYAYFLNDQMGQILVNKLFKTNDSYLILPPEKTLEMFRKTGFWIPGHATVFRMAAVRKYGGYQEKIRHFSDFYLAHKIALTETIAYIPEGLSAMRISPHSFSAQSAASKELRINVLRDFLALLLQDEDKELFQKSTLLGPALKKDLLFVLLRPRYWGFLRPVVQKKILKWLGFL